jgi:pentapeptide MXKDX repeat protein
LPHEAAAIELGRTIMTIRTFTAAAAVLGLCLVAGSASAQTSMDTMKKSDTMKTDTMKSDAMTTNSMKMATTKSDCMHKAGMQKDSMKKSEMMKHCEAMK